jgi:hypothetical protein
MLEYIFFHPVPEKLFIEWLTENKIQSENSQDGESFIVSVDEDLAEDTYKKIEEKYEILLEMNEEIMMAENADDTSYHMAGVAVHLRDGWVSYADIDPKLMGRIIGVITPEEFATVVDAIVTAVESPQGQTYCQRQREGDS